MKNGIIYNGPSLLDGKPIVVIATYSDRNTKTGKVLQTYIIRSDISPLEASKSGEDYSICADCKFRGTPTTDPDRKQAKERECYVNLGQGPTIVYKAYKRGVYPVAITIQGDGFVIDQVQTLGADRIVRIGTYGDPAAVPSWAWDRLIKRCKSWLAYSHQSGWRPDIAMQSADTMAEAVEHWKAGHRTFRVIADLGDLDKTKEILCPASKEAGRRVQCTACKLCKGSSPAKSIAIVQH
jgi:hypothetical protein|tara:strand:- start:2637 stop:3350 length:714 start_codon:yes stop_codon:yes gene_type:complete